jgi:hypothetical protein
MAKKEQLTVSEQEAVKQEAVEQEAAEQAAAETDAVFQVHPHLDVYYKTSDGAVFFTENAAAIHTNGLNDKMIDRVLNKQ